MLSPDIPDCMKENTSEEWHSGESEKDGSGSPFPVLLEFSVCFTIQNTMTT